MTRNNGTLPCQQPTYRFPPWMPTTKEKLREMVRDGQPAIGVAKQIARSWAMAEYDRTRGDTYAADEVYTEVIRECGYDPDGADFWGALR